MSVPFCLAVEAHSSPRAFRPLEYGPKEAAAIRAIMGSNVEVSSGLDARESSLRALMSPRVLHLATHGSYDVALNQPNVSQPVTLDTIARTTNYARYVESLTRSGLSLSGANLHHVDGVDDGCLTAYDVIGINFSRTDLVMISACKTGLGTRQSGEGFMSVSRAFSIAGARYVITAGGRSATQRPLVRSASSTVSMPRIRVPSRPYGPYSWSA